MTSGKFRMLHCHPMQDCSKPLPNMSHLPLHSLGPVRMCLVLVSSKSLVAMPLLMFCHPCLLEQQPVCLQTWNVLYMTSGRHKMLHCHPVQDCSKPLPNMSHLPLHSLGPVRMCLVLVSSKSLVAMPLLMFCHPCLLEQQPVCLQTLECVVHDQWQAQNAALPSSAGLQQAIAQHEPFAFAQPGSCQNVFSPGVGLLQPPTQQEPSINVLPPTRLLLGGWLQQTYTRTKHILTGPRLCKCKWLMLGNGLLQSCTGWQCSILSLPMAMYNIFHVCRHASCCHNRHGWQHISKGIATGLLLDGWLQQTYTRAKHIVKGHRLCNGKWLMVGTGLLHPGTWWQHRILLHGCILQLRQCFYAQKKCCRCSPNGHF